LEVWDHLKVLWEEIFQLKQGNQTIILGNQERVLKEVSEGERLEVNIHLLIFAGEARTIKGASRKSWERGGFSTSGWRLC